MLEAFDLAVGMEAELGRVEEKLRNWTLSRVPEVSSIAQQIIGAGGKRIRPSLVVLCARACSGSLDPERLVTVATSVELMHMASLVHDDVIDHADTRRGLPTANRAWGNHTAVLSGDYMWAAATSMLAQDGDVEIMKLLSETALAMIEGVVAELKEFDGTDNMRARYLEIVRLKTAELMSASCQAGAMLTQADPDMRASLGDYGLALGMAFQVTDDLLDILGDPARTGKPAGGDLREGKLTMPTILALKAATPGDAARLVDILQADELTADDLQFAKSLVVTTGAADATRRSASEYASRAREALQALPPSEALSRLDGLAEFILTREG